MPTEDQSQKSADSTNRDPSLPSGPEAGADRSYGQILKSSAVIGGSSVLVVLTGIVRTKAMALLLGPAGFGLMGVYGSILDLVMNIAGMGVGSSGVRQIAESVGSGDAARISRTVFVIKRTVIVLGVVGSAALAILAPRVSLLTFGNDEYALPIAILSLAVFFRVVAAGQAALIQGMRRIGDLAWMSVIGSLAGTAASVALVYVLGADGVAPSLVIGAAVGLIVAWWYSRRIQATPALMSGSEVRLETWLLLRLGFAFMASGFMMMGAAYAVRTIILRYVGLEAAGLYQAAWTLGGLYVGTILQAMGTDFYPRVTEVIKDSQQSNRLVNEQAQVSLLLAGPGVIATLIFAPLLMIVFYSSEFAAATGVLQWICLGMALRVITWPMGFIIVARGEQTIFFLTELAWTVVNVGLSIVCLRYFGLVGAGMAFFGSYVFHGLMIYPIVRRLHDFRWSLENLKVGLSFVTLIGVVFASSVLLPGAVSIAFGAVAFAASGVYSVRRLVSLVGVGHVPKAVQKLLFATRLARMPVRS